MSSKKKSASKASGNKTSGSKREAEVITTNDIATVDAADLVGPVQSETTPPADDSDVDTEGQTTGETSEAAPPTAPASIVLHLRKDNKAIRYGQEGVHGSLRFSKNMFANGEFPESVTLIASNLATPTTKAAKTTATGTSEEKAQEIREKAQKATERAEKAQLRAQKAIDRAKKLGVDLSAPATTPETTEQPATEQPETVEA